MTLRQEIRTGLATVLAAAVACPPAQALVALNEGRDRIFVTASVTASHDSNVFANSDQAADYVIASNILAEYTRRAGWIGVNGSVSVSGSNFGEHQEQNFSNPSYALEFTKQSGRTTGSLSFSGARESRADAAVNMRSTSWNYNTGLNVKYPAGVNTFTSSMSYSSRRYADSAVFVDLATYASSFDLIRILPAERELVAGYRYRLSETSRDTSTTDHSATVGIQGRLIRGVVGSLRGGWQMRVPHGGVTNQPTFSSWTFSASTSYALSKKLNLGLTASKDFSTTATDSSVDVTSASLDTSYAIGRKISVTAGAGWGLTRFLGEGGRVILDPGPPVVLGAQRTDNYANWSTGISYAFHEHLKLSANYNWFQNWSTNAFSDFVRRSWGFSATSRW